MSPTSLDLLAARHVDEGRLWQRHMTMGAIGGTPRGGVNRLALTPLDAAAQRTLAAWAGERGFTCARDPIGNLIVRREGTDPAAAPVVTGSHLDSQPTGGKFDGTYGVLAGLEVLEALEDAGVRTRRPMEVIAWMNEEGSRFQPGCMGSAVYCGAMPLDPVLATRDGEGVSVGEALAQVLAAAPLPARPLPAAAPAAYFEAHIEQGPRLEAEGATIGVVTGIQGSVRATVEIAGVEAHAGTTPRAVRRDAVSAAVAAIAALEVLTHDPDDVTRFTVGRMEVQPNSPNTVPAKVRFSIDLRHPDAATLARLSAGIDAAVHAAVASRRCTAVITRHVHVEPTRFPDEAVGLVRAATRALGLRYLDMPSGAGHDAMYLARICPAAMVFVPCLGGVSHNEAESATAADLAAGTRVLAAAMVAAAG